jgi:hypothetical protein
LTLPPETIPSCYLGMRYGQFQPLPGRHHFRLLARHETHAFESKNDSIYKAWLRKHDLPEQIRARTVNIIVICYRVAATGNQEPVRVIALTDFDENSVPQKAQSGVCFSIAAVGARRNENSIPQDSAIFDY